MGRNIPKFKEIYQSSEWSLSSDRTVVCLVFLEFYLFIYLFGSSLLHAGLSLVVASGGHASLRCGASHCGGFSLRSAGFSSCRMRAQQLWRSTGLAAPRHVGSSRTRARTHIPCTGRRILNHCATREVPRVLYFFTLLYFPFYMVRTFHLKKDMLLGFPGDAVVKNPPANTGDTG